MTSAAFLIVVASFGVVAAGGVLGLRARDQRNRDARRETVILRFPRGVRPEMVLAVVRTILGLSPGRSGLTGRDSVALELSGTAAGITHRLRLPAAASTYLIAQLRAAVPGLAVAPVDAPTPLLVRAAVELRRRLTAADLAIADVTTTNRTILAALSGTERGETVVWQVVVTGGISERPADTRRWWQRLGGTEPEPKPVAASDTGVASVVIRLGAVAPTKRRADELVARLRRAAGSVAAPQARLIPRLIPARIVAGRITRAATPLVAAPVLLRPDELVALSGWPVGTPLIPGLSLGGSPQLPASGSVPRRGRVLGRATADGRAVAQPISGATEHMMVLGPTGTGKSVLAAKIFLDDVAAGRGALVVDPKGTISNWVIERLPEEAIGRTVIVDPTDAERPVPLPLLAAEAGGIPELAADTLVGLLRHRYRDLGPRSSDILSSSLYALARVPGATLMDLLTLWGDARFRAQVAGRASDDPVLAGFFAWFDGLGTAERTFIVAAPLNKIRPLLQRAVVRNCIAAPRATFTIAQAMRERLVVIVRLPEGVLGAEATSLLGQVVTSRVWAATQARRGRSFYGVTLDEAPRFVDTGTDLGDMLARSREYGVGVTLVAQSLAMFTPTLREVTLNNARTKVAFGTSPADARRLAAEFGPGVEADFFTGLARYEAIGAVSLGGTVSQPFTFATDALGPRIPGRARAVRQASRERFGIPRAEIEAALRRTPGEDERPAGPVGRRAL